jgi:hypothetical protein
MREELDIIKKRRLAWIARLVPLLLRRRTSCGTTGRGVLLWLWLHLRVVEPKEGRGRGGRHRKKATKTLLSFFQFLSPLSQSAGSSNTFVPLLDSALR